MTVPQAFQVALQHHQSGGLAEAEALYRQILAVQPNHAESWHFLGVIAHQAGRNDLAVEQIRRALALQPNYPAALSNLGAILIEQGHRAEAIAAYRRAIELAPDYAEAHSNLGSALREQGHRDEAIAACRRAIQCRPDYAEAHSNLGIALRDRGRPGEAIAACRRAIELRPGYAEAHCNLGVALRDQGRLEEAAAAYRRAIELKPDFAEVHCNLGIVLWDQDQFDGAVAACRRAIELKPGFAEAHSNLGNALRDKGQLDEAIAAYHRAIQLKPGVGEMHNNLGSALRDQGRFDEALAAYRRAIQLQPGSPEAKWNTSHLLLLEGDFEHGWPLFESRWETAGVIQSKRNFPQPMWQGEALHGQRVLLYAEQGLGDTLQFVRYAPLIAQRGGRVIVECQPGLKALLASLEGIAQIIECGEPLPDFDLHIPMMSLPLAFGTRVETIPANIPYLRADPQKVARWRKRLEQETDPAADLAAPSDPLVRSVPSDLSRRAPLKVGLVWAGGERPHQPKLRPVNQRRSMRLSQFAPLAAMPGAVFVSLQKGAPSAEAKTPPEGMHLLDWTDELEDFADTAALVECLDLVISVDTAVAHLAGALGKPVWLLNRFDTCWRWLMKREDSPWYPTLRLFRQPSFMNWEPVMAEVRRQLELRSSVRQ